MAGPSFTIPPIDIGASGGSAPGPAFRIPPIDLNARAPADSGHVGTGTGSFLHGLKEGFLDTVHALPGIAIEAATHPGRLAEETVQGLVDEAKWTGTLGRAFTNLATGDVADFRKFYDAYEQHFYANPFGTSLFILGGGKGIGGRLGAVRELAPLSRAPSAIVEAARREPRAALRAAVLGWDTPESTRYVTARLGEDIKGIGQQGEEIVTRRIGRGHMAANRAYAIDSLLKMTPARTPLIGVDKRVSRATRTEGRVPYLRLLSAPEYITRQKTARALTRNEAVAAGMRNKVPFAEDLETWTTNLKALGADEAEALLRQMENPAVRKLYMEGSPRIEAHEAAGRALEPLRTQIMVDTGALSLREAEAAPWRLTRQLRGAHLATPAWLYKQRRKLDAQINQFTGAKGRLVPAAKVFGNKDKRAAMKEARAASADAIKESGVRGRIIGDLNKEVRLKGEPPVPGLARAEAAELISPPPEPKRIVTDDIQKEVDDAFEEKETLSEDLSMLARGESTQAFLDKMGMRPKEGWGRTEQAFAEATHKALRKEHLTELKRLKSLLKLARQRRLPARALDAMGLRIPSDIKVPTPAELEEATRLRAQMEAIKQRLKEAKRFRLNETEKTRMRATIDEMGQQIRELENPKAMHRSPSSLKRQFESRYLRAEKKLMKQIAAKEQTLKEIGEEIGVVEDPNEYVHTAALGVMDKRFRKAVIRYERALAAEVAHAESVIRGLEAKERQASSEAELARLRDLKINFIQAQRLRLHDLNEAINDRVALKNDLDSRLGELVGGGEPWELKLEAEKAGRPVPYYSPDEMLKTERNGRMGLAEGSILAQRLRGDIYGSRSILARTGALALHPDTLSPAYFRAAKHALNVAMHEQAMKLATRIGKDVPLPKGYEYLRRTPGETISETAKYRGEHLRAMEHQFGREEDLTSTTDDGTIDFSEADGSEYRLIVPKAYADEFRAEGLRSQGAVGKIFSQSMDVWRSLVLHLRVPWLVNNVVGNTFLFAMRFAGLQGLKEFAQMAASNPVSRKFIPSMKRLALEHLTSEQVREIFPEQVRGTHFETQAPELPNITPRALRDRIEQSPRGKRGLQALSDIPRVLPKIDKAYERKLRQAATNQVLRGSPEIKAIYKEMKKQGSGSFHDAVTKALEGDPHLRNLVVREVNDALGNFLSLTRAERHLLRRVVPFYAWMREITRISGRLLVDHPGRVLLLNQLAQATAEIHPEDIPEYLRGAVASEDTGWLQKLIGGAPDGLASALNLRGMAPYATLADEFTGAAALLPGSSDTNTREFVGNFTPAVAGLYNVTAHGGEGNLLARYAEELLRSVPQSQLVAPYDSTLYPGRGRLDIAAKLFLANPKITYDPDEASFQRFQGR